jgi:hypothetical protein
VRDVTRNNFLLHIINQCINQSMHQSIDASINHRRHARLDGFFLGLFLGHGSHVKQAVVCSTAAHLSTGGFPLDTTF